MGDLDSEVELVGLAFERRTSRDRLAANECPVGTLRNQDTGRLQCPNSRNWTSLEVLVLHHRTVFRLLSVTESRLRSRLIQGGAS
jgi:hypothetical protein